MALHKDIQHAVPQLERDNSRKHLLFHLTQKMIFIMLVLYYQENESGVGS